MIDAFLKTLYETGVDHDSVQTDRSSKVLNITPETGAFLALLLQEAKPRSILEIGTSNGYSTIWLARARASFASNVVSVDALAEKTKLAKSNLTKVGLIDSVTLFTMDAGAYLKEADNQSFDFVFLDASRSDYVHWWRDLRRIMDWGILVVDNALSHKDEMHSFVSLIRSQPELDHVVLPIGKGQLIVTGKHYK
ncbi:MAG: class I SAM-dependent methyltransferase [Rhodothermaceae bacterium]|nr:class I SAM-dependent methyltransferase [Rhodothermaceae bacterium]